MKHIFYYFAVVLAISLAFASCKKSSNQTQENPTNFIDLKVSQAFDFENFSNLETSIQLSNTKAAGVEIIQIYDAHPSNGGKLILTGSVDENGVFNLPIRLASRLSEVYVGKLSSIGINEYVAVPIVGNAIHVDFAGLKSTTDNDPCTSGCTTTASGTYNSNFIIGVNEVVCVDEGTSATFKKLHIDAGGVLRVCGNVTVTNYKNGSGEGTLLINDAGTVNLPKYSLDLTVENYGQLNFSGSGGGSSTIQINGEIENYGEISSVIKMENHGLITNNGTFTTTQDFKIQPAKTLINNCQFLVNSNSKFEQSGFFTNNGYLYVSDEAKFTGNSETTIGLGSLIKTYDFKIEGEISGPNSTPAQITASHDGEVDGSADISNLDLCANNEDYNNNATYTNVTYCVNEVWPAPQCAAATAPEITSSLTLGGLVDQTITPYVITASGTEVITYSVSTLPAGLTFNPATHTISGTPTVAGTFNVVMTANNVMGTDTKTLVIQITQPTAAPVITSVLVDETTVDESYTYTLVATGEGPITYNAINLPAGLEFDTDTHQITGVPTTAGMYNITLAATNAGGTTTETLVLTVGTPPTITSELTASGTAAVQFTAYTFTAEGSPDISYQIDNLPQGLSFNPVTQTINGTPTYAGVYNATLTASNAYGADVQTLVITINEGAQPPVIISSLTANAMKDFPFSYSIVAEGSQPMEYNATNLPTGLTFDGNTISGIPANAGIYEITLIATNSAGTDTKILVLTVGTGGGTDTDGDGVPDNLDAYPTDPTRAFNSYYPNEVDFASLAFEDLWPAYGDYDFNDFVVNVNYKMVTNAQNETVDVIARYQIMADGASLDNGFGIVFDAPSSSVESVTGCIKLGIAVQIDPKGFEVGHANTTVVIPFDAINPIMEGGMANTIPGGKYVQTTINTVTTHFSTPQASIGTPPFNPFIFVDQERGHEVHLKDQPPTDLVDMDYFGTDNDASDPAIGLYYRSSTGLPFGVEVPVNFNYPIEKADILTAHLKFAEWAQSSGVDYTDWYMDKPGYRNDANIYEIPE